MKLCKDCKHFKRGDWGYGNCYHPQNMMIEYENGGLETRNSIKTMRTDGPCKEEGLLYEPARLPDFRDGQMKDQLYPTRQDWDALKYPRGRD